jgi:hypothetical protein
MSVGTQLDGRRANGWTLQVQRRTLILELKALALGFVSALLQPTDSPSGYHQMAETHRAVAASGTTITAHNAHL